MDDKVWIIGNWKSNKTVAEALAWIKEFGKLAHVNQSIFEKIHVVLCPTFIHLEPLNSEIKKQNIPLILGSQTISSFGSGAYTGAISAEAVKDLVTYSLVGHSERKKYFSETAEILSQQTEQARAVGITPIYCVTSADEVVPDEISYIAYEPVEAIGSGKAETPEAAQETAQAIRARKSDTTIFYGGSVKADNVTSYLTLPDISGVLVGGASLTAQSFFDIVLHATQT
ncbi:triosephosphate isomerase [Candidatus Microgenomates bacterium]|nr:MAG: triosephosphate isomerase [Candidatus Microgenomates bacterium]